MSRHATTSSGRLPSLLALTLWGYQRLLMVHPSAFRREFGLDINLVFRQMCLDAYRCDGAPGVLRLWLPALVDVLAGALAEYGSLLKQTLKGTSHMLQYRRSVSVIFAAYIAFVIAGIGFNKMSEETMKSSLPATYPLLRISYDVMAVGAAVSLLAILAGGIPVAWAALRYALANRRYDILARFAVPPVALLAIIATAFVVVTYNIGGNTPATLHSPARIAAIGSVIAVFIIGAAASTYAMLDAIARANVDERLLRFTMLPAVVATIAMACMLLAHLVWSIVLWQDAPNRFFGNEGVLASSTLVSTAIQVALMVVATVIAARALGRGFAARRETPRLA